MNKNNTQRNFGNLPQHQPSASVWDNIATRLNVEQKLDIATKLPIHTPASSTWRNIENKIHKNKIKKWAYSAAAAAVLFLLVGLGWLVNQRSIQQPPYVHTISKPDSGKKTGENNPTPKTNNIHVQVSRAHPEKSHAKKEQHPYPLYLSIDLTPLKVPELTANIFLEAKQENVLTAHAINEKFTLSETPKTSISHTLDLHANDNLLTSKKQNKTDLSLGVNYVSQALQNNINTTAYQNVNIALAYKKSNFRVHTSLGYGYIFEKENKDKDAPTYSAKEKSSDVLFLDNRGNVTQAPQIMNELISENFSSARDIAEFNNLTQNPYNPKHPFLLYDLGISYKIFETHKVSGWIKTASGIAFKLDKKSGEETETQRLNAILNEKKSNYLLPYNKYNSLNLNFSASFQIDYRLFKRFSVFAEPTGYYYAIGVFEGYKNSPDKLSFGIKIGTQYDL